MRLRVTCKCGAVFEGRAIVADNLSDPYRAFVGLHNLCYGVTWMREDEHGKLLYTLASEDQPEEDPA